MNKNIIIITFDSYRHDYPSVSYSIASLLATLKHFEIPASHYPVNIKEFIGGSRNDYTAAIKEELKNSIEYFKKFDFIAIGVTCWSIEHTNEIIDLLGDYEGKIVLGGYEITAIDDNDLIIEFPRADFFVKGYGEKALIKLINGEYKNHEKVLFEALDQAYLFSPYDKNVLNTYTRKIYWETKRGCKFKCGFCEWGNAQIGSIPLASEVIDKDIAIFSKSNVEEINILDGTFNVPNDYLAILKKLVEKTNAKIIFQARFEALNDEFMQYCSANNNRLHLEFGLQTIHELEMKVIGRRNNLDIISKRLHELNRLKIDYEVSIIYAIPGQTVESFIDSIEFLRIHNCKKIMAYPLQVPRNSELEKKSNQYLITFIKDKINVQSVASSYSFNIEARRDMDRIAQSLSTMNYFSQLIQSNKHKIERTEYQYQIPAKFIKKNIEEFLGILQKEFFSSTLETISVLYSSYESFMDIGHQYLKEDYVAIACGEKPLSFNKDYSDHEYIDHNNNSVSHNRRKGLNPTDFYCKMALGESGHLYIYSELRER